MPSFLVKQPNGDYARFSTIPDGFTDADMTRDEAWTRVRDEAGNDAATTKLANADNDAPCATDNVAKAPDGLGRWRSCLRTVAAIHGAVSLRQTLAEFAMESSEQDRWYEETMASIAKGGA